MGGITVKNTVKMLALIAIGVAIGRALEIEFYED